MHTILTLRRRKRVRSSMTSRPAPHCTPRLRSWVSRIGPRVRTACQDDYRQLSSSHHNWHAPERPQISQLESSFRISPLRRGRDTENEHSQTVLVVWCAKRFPILRVEDAYEIRDGRQQLRDQPRPSSSQAVRRTLVVSPTLCSAKRFSFLKGTVSQLSSQAESRLKRTCQRSLKGRSTRVRVLLFVCRERC